MREVFESIGEAYKRNGLLSLVSIVAVSLGIFTVVKYQTVSIPALPDLFNALQNDGKTVVLTFSLNLFSAVLLISVAVGWFISAFKSDNYHSYSYYDSSNELIIRAAQIVTGLALFLFGLSFVSYIINNILIVLIVGVVVAIGLWGSGKK